MFQVQKNNVGQYAYERLMQYNLEYPPILKYWIEYFIYVGRIKPESSTKAGYLANVIQFSGNPRDY